jgi:predicted transcriptional regulator
MNTSEDYSMNAVRPIAVKLDQETRDRLKRLADAKDRSTHWMLREAVAQFVEREEKRQAFREDGLQAWKEYQATGKYVTHIEADTWLAKLEAGEEADVPECRS